MRLPLFFLVLLFGFLFWCFIRHGLERMGVSVELIELEMFRVGDPCIVVAPASG